MFLKCSWKSSITSVDRWLAAVSISMSVSRNARGMAKRKRSTKPCPWSIFAMSFATLSNCVEPNVLKGVLAGMTLLSSVE